MSSFCPARVKIAALFFALLTVLAVALPAPAFASCIPSEDELAAYAEDGTLAARQAYQKALGNDSFDEELIEHAQAAEGLSNARNAVSSEWRGGMPTTGTARVLAIRVAFPAEGDQPAMGFEDDDTLEALQALINGAGGQAPYESLNAFYQRSSYQALSFAGEAYDYTAQHARSYYTDRVDELFREAVTALVEEQGVDLARFDGNGDKLIDGVYIHFAGGTTGWGSTWWSNHRHNANKESIEGTDMIVDSEVLLHEPSCDSGTSKTVIHETGHALGLPDYYPYESGASKGIDTFDMMYSNAGDHCAFSKWLLGWIDSENITRMAVGESGVTVQEGTGPQRHEETVSQALSALESDDSSAEGGFIAVSDSQGIFDGEGLLSSFYLLQYDRKEGNLVEAAPEDPGFRMYRVQASLNEQGTNFEKSNSYGKDGDKLIEALNTGLNYSSYLYAGDSVTPTTKPSTNFFEDVGRGYTGIAVTVQETQSAQGTVGVSYEPVSPVDPSGFSVGLEGGNAVRCVDKRALEFSMPATLSPQAGVGDLDAKLYVEGIEYPDYIIVELEQGSYTVSWTLASKNFKPGTKAELVFPEGYFSLGRGTEGPVYSPEVRVQLTSSEENIAVVNAGCYESTRQDDGADYDCLSDVVTSGSDELFFQVHAEPYYEGEAEGRGVSSSCVLMNRISGSDVAQCSTTVVTGTEGSWLEDWLSVQGSAPSANSLQGATALAAGNGQVALKITNKNSTVGETRSVVAFIDAETGALLGQCEGPNEELGHWLSWNGKVLYADNSGGNLLLTAYEPDGEGGVKETYAYVTGVEGVLDAGGSCVVAYTAADSETPGHTLMLLSGEAEAGLTFCDSRFEAEGYAVSLKDLPATCSFTSEGSVDIEAAAANDDALWVCSRNFGTPSGGGAVPLVNCLTKYSFAGDVVRCEYDRPSMSDAPNPRLSVGSPGLAAVQWNSNKYDKGQGIAFFGQSLESVRYSTSFGGSKGLWRGENFLQVGYPLMSSSEGEDAENVVRYSVYQPGSSPVDPVGPVNPGGSDSPDNPDGKIATAKTGDALQGVLPFVGGACAIAAVAAVVCAVKMRRRR